jgi:hypothetical protein
MIFQYLFPLTYVVYAFVPIWSSSMWKCMYLCKVHPYITLVHNTCTLCMKVNGNFMGVEWYHEVKNVNFFGYWNISWK